MEVEYDENSNNKNIEEIQENEFIDNYYKEENENFEINNNLKINISSCANNIINLREPSSNISSPSSNSFNYSTNLRNLNNLIKTNINNTKLSQLFQNKRFTNILHYTLEYLNYDDILKTSSLTKNLFEKVKILLQTNSIK